MATAGDDKKLQSGDSDEKIDEEGLTTSKTKDISSYFVKEPSSKKQKVEAITICHVKGDLFKCPDTESLVHCVSKDLHMGKGIATLFKQKFGGVQELKDQRKGIGDVAVLQRDGRFIYYLITKERYFHKPTYKSLEDTLVLMRKHCVENNVTRLSMPKIGCGLDKLEWNKVEALLKKVFLGSGVHITVYSF